MYLKWCPVGTSNIYRKALFYKELVFFYSQNYSDFIYTCQ
nr:MAG TPA: hypothetical protein [Caudoviricetes sp.]